ncbi:hypothetical protein BGZ98_001128 [Dissophora globulifera]|nr:hypothetical protein BGZ98_001128 [Dissophora globulifera]
MVSPMLRRRPSRFVLLLAAAVVLFPDELYSVSAADVPVAGALVDKPIDNSIATNVTPQQPSQQKQSAEAHAPIIDDLVALYNADVVDKKNSKGVQKNDAENFNKKGIKMKKKHKPIENGNKEGKQEERPQQPQQDVDEYLADLWKGIVHLGQDPTIQAGISALTTATHSSSQSRRQRNERRDFTQNDRRQTMTGLENDEVVAATKKPRKQKTAGSYAGAGLNQKATMSKNQRNEEYLGASRKMNPSTRPAAHQLLKKRQTLNQRGTTVPLGPWMAPDYEDWNDLFDAENVINIEGVKEDKDDNDDKQIQKQKNIGYKQQNINAKQEHQRQQQQDDMALRDEELNIDGENEEQGNKKENRKEKKKDKDQQDDEYLGPAADDTFMGYDNDDFEVNALNDADQKKNKKDKKIKKDKKHKNKIDNHNKHNGLHDLPKWRTLSATMSKTSWTETDSVIPSRLELLPRLPLQMPLRLRLQHKLKIPRAKPLFPPLLPPLLLHLPRSKTRSLLLRLLQPKVKLLIPYLLQPKVKAPLSHLFQAKDNSARNLLPEEERQAELHRVLVPVPAETLARADMAQYQCLVLHSSI